MSMSTEEHAALARALESIGQGKHLSTLVENDVTDVETFVMLEAKDLEDMKIAIGGKKKMLQKIKELKEEMEARSNEDNILPDQEDVVYEATAKAIAPASFGASAS
jgi:hypothetical protein